MSLFDEMTFTYDTYVMLLSKEIDNLLGISIAHGYNGNNESYLEGVRLRNKIAELKKQHKNEDAVDYSNYLQYYLSDMELLSYKQQLIAMLGNGNIEILSYLPYPSVVRHCILLTDFNFKTKEHDWLTEFANRMLEVECPKYNICVDNKIAIRFQLHIKSSEYITPLWFGSRDGQYYIGLSAENMDGVHEIKL